MVIGVVTMEEEKEESVDMLGSGDGWDWNL